ncbi:MAG: T9SS type A sorting domain-containing protein [Bacteroidota bacterium]
MKNALTLCTLLFVTTVAMAQPTRTTVQNGNATNPLTWDCTCIPLPGDNIVVNHALTLNTDFAYSSGSFLINASGSCTGDIPTRGMAVLGGSFINHGTFSVGNFYHSGGTFTNDGTILIGNLYGVDQTATETNTGTITISDSLFVNTNAAFINNGNSSAPVIATAGTITNNSTMSCSYLWNSGTVNHNSGVMTVTNDILTSGTINVNASLSVDYDIWNSGVFDNGTSQIDVGHSLYTGDSTALPATFTNDGLISVNNDLYNNKTLNGSGRFCVGQVTANSGTISGTLDICDQTGGAIDFNTGTIAGTVTYCAVNCNVGTGDEEKDEFSIYPNPFDNQVIIKRTSSDSQNFILLNALGQVVMKMKLTAAQTKLDMSELNSGIYFYSVEENGAKTQSGRLLKK